MYLQVSYHIFIIIAYMTNEICLSLGKERSNVLVTRQALLSAALVVAVEVPSSSLTSPKRSEQGLAHAWINAYCAAYLQEHRCRREELVLRHRWAFHLCWH
jgi:hypothetical protein